MSEKNLHNDFPDLASRYLSGNASDEEVRTLEEWVKSDPQHRRAFMEFKQAWMLSGMREPAPVDTDARWEQTAAELFDSGRIVELSSRRRWMSVAAAVAVLAIIAALLWIQPWATEDVRIATTDSTETVELADGSSVVLNRRSSFSYVYDEKRQVRQVELTGDAFFDVARDEDRPFVIQARMVEIEVLGTSFYVDGRTDQPEVQVSVAAGSVAVRANDQEVILQPRQTAVFQIDKQQLTVQATEDSNYESLKTSILTFSESTLTDVVFTLNRYYRSDIRIESEALKNCRFSSTFNDKSLEAVLAILESSFQLEVNRQGDTILLSGKCSPED